MKCSIEANTNGKGAHSEEARKVLITEVKIGYSNQEYYPESEFAGELRAYFDPTGLSPGAWNIDAYGLICTDKQWLREFKAGLRTLGISIKGVQNIKYGEQGLQRHNYVSMDIGPVFYASWKRINKVKKNETETIPNITT